MEFDIREVNISTHLSASSKITILCRPGGSVTFFWANILILFLTTSIPLHKKETLRNIKLVMDNKERKKLNNTKTINATCHLKHLAPIQPLYNLAPVVHEQEPIYLWFYQFQEDPGNIRQLLVAADSKDLVMVSKHMTIFALKFTYKIPLIHFNNLILTVRLLSKCTDTSTNLQLRLI